MKKKNEFSRVAHVTQRARAVAHGAGHVRLAYSARRPAAGNVARAGDFVKGTLIFSRITTKY